jgi:predicted dehydrogenase
MKKTLNLAFLGGGINSAVGKTHILASQLDSHWKIVGGKFSRDIEISRKSAHDYSVLNVFEDFNQKVIEVNKIDVVAVLTPTPSHFEHVLELLNLGVDVICEKSISTSSKEAEIIASEAVKLNRKVYVTFNYTGFPMVREIRKRIEDGELGELHHVRIEMPQESFIKNSEKPTGVQVQEWRTLDYSLPTVMLDLGVHVINLIHFLTGNQMISVFSLGSHHGKVKNVIDEVNMLGNYKGGMHANIWFGKTYLGHRNGLRIQLYGNMGSIQWNLQSPDVFVQTDKYGNDKFIHLDTLGLKVANLPQYNRFKPGHPTGFIEAFANCYNDIYLDLISESNQNFSKQFVFNANQASLGLKELEAAFESSISATMRQII